MPATPRAGFTPSDALAAVTSAPASVFHLNDRGRIAPSLRADLLLVLGHRNGESALSSPSANQIAGERVSLNLLGDGYIEAVDGRDIEQNAEQQRKADPGIGGTLVSAPLLEAPKSPPKKQIGRFGWKSQHSSLMSSCADSLRNELGVRNRLYPDEYQTHVATDNPTPFDIPDAQDRIGTTGR